MSRRSFMGAFVGSLLEIGIWIAFGGFVIAVAVTFAKWGLEGMVHRIQQKDPATAPVTQPAK